MNPDTLAYPQAMLNISRGTSIRAMLNTDRGMLAWSKGQVVMVSNMSTQSTEWHD